MAKDPAFLFYSQDFLVGTQFMSDEQVGKYIRLLCYQHQNGRLTENHMNFICKSYDNDVFSKFKRDSDGNYYNERLEDESIKRQKYCESRGKNKKGKKIISKSYDFHMENENENINNNNNGIENPVASNLYSLEQCADIAGRDETWVMNSGFTGKIKEEFIKHLKGTGEEKKNVADFKKHFYNWKRKQPEKKKLVFK